MFQKHPSIILPLKGIVTGKYQHEAKELCQRRIFFDFNILIDALLVPVGNEIQIGLAHRYFHCKKHDFCTA